MSFLSEPVQALVAINMLLTLSLLFPFAAGVWSLGLPGFMAIGAYTSGFASTVLGWPVPSAIAAGMLAGMVSTLPVGLLALRTRGVYLSIATLAESELINLFFSHFEPTGATLGMSGMPFVSEKMLIAAAVVVFAVSLWIFNSRVGKAIIAAGSDPLVASCSGLNVPYLQLGSLALSGVFAGLAGGLFAHYYSFISPANFGATRVVDILMFLVVGGVTPFGAVAGSAVLTLIPQVAAGLEKWAPAIYGVVVMLTMAFLPDGVFPKNRFAMLRDLRARKRGAALPAAAVQPTAS
ncbi:MAG: branched-chain amino acid ABC transporter permease [Variovorax sp.]